MEALHLGVILQMKMDRKWRWTENDIWNIWQDSYHAPLTTVRTPCKNAGIASTPRHQRGHACRGGRNEVCVPWLLSVNENCDISHICEWSCLGERGVSMMKYGGEICWNMLDNVHESTVHEFTARRDGRKCSSETMQLHYNFIAWSLSVLDISWLLFLKFECSWCFLTLVLEVCVFLTFLGSSPWSFSVPCISKTVDTCRADYKAVGAENAGCSIPSVSRFLFVCGGLSLNGKQTTQPISTNHNNEKGQ